MNKLSRQLARSAKANGICKEWFDRLRGQTEIAGLVAMYIKGIDFCMAHNWPDLETLRRDFAGDPFVADHGIFIDKKDVDVKNRATSVLLGASEAAIAFNGYEVGEIYVRHDSRLNLAVSGHAFVVVDVYDRAMVKITAMDHAKVIVKDHNRCLIGVDHDPAAVVKINNKVINADPVGL